MVKSLKKQVRKKYGDKMVTPNTIEDNKGYPVREALGWNKFDVGDKITASMDRRLKDGVARVGNYLSPALKSVYREKPKIFILRNIKTAAIPKANRINIDRKYVFKSQKELEGALGEEYTHLAHGRSNPETDPWEEHDEGKRFEKSSVTEAAGGLGRMIVERRYGKPEGLEIEDNEDAAHKHGYSAAENMYNSNPNKKSRMNELGNFVKMPLKKAKVYVDEKSSYKIEVVRDG